LTCSHAIYMQMLKDMKTWQLILEDRIEVDVHTTLHCKGQELLLKNS